VSSFDQLAIALRVGERSMPCFRRGTLISTPEGDIAVEELEAGGYVCVYGGVWAGQIKSVYSDVTTDALVVSYLKEIAAEAGVRPKTLAAAKRGLSLTERLRPDDGELYWFLPPNVVGFFPKEHQSPQSARAPLEARLRTHTAH
jgi:hypothetical protein